MILATVEGNLVSTVKIPPFHAKRLMVVQPVDLQGRPEGKQVLAVDNVNAGVGDLVICVNEGSSAQLIFNDKTLPLQMVIVGIVDGVDYKIEDDTPENSVKGVLKTENPVPAVSKGRTRKKKAESRK